jgi:hypothetical protein
VQVQYRYNAFPNIFNPWAVESAEPETHGYRGPNVHVLYICVYIQTTLLHASTKNKQIMTRNGICSFSFKRFHFSSQQVKVIAVSQSEKIDTFSKRNLLPSPYFTL